MLIILGIFGKDLPNFTTISLSGSSVFPDVSEFKLKGTNRI